MKEYNISEVAKMFGISSESLRNYERRGLVAPLRNESGYRTYTKPDIYTLSGIRFLRNAGYSLEDIELLFHCSYEEALATRQKRCDELEQEIAYLQLKLKAIRKERDDFQALYENDISWTTSPAMLRVDNQINDYFLTNNPVILKWVDHLPIVRISPAFSKEAILNGQDEVRFGYAVPEEVAKPLGLDNTPGIERKESQACLTTVLCSQGENYINARMLGYVLQFCQEQHLKLTGDVWGITIGVYREAGQIKRHHRLYIPVSSM